MRLRERRAACVQRGEFGRLSGVQRLAVMQKALEQSSAALTLPAARHRFGMLKGACGVQRAAMSPESRIDIVTLAFFVVGKGISGSGRRLTGCQCVAQWWGPSEGIVFGLQTSLPNTRHYIPNKSITRQCRPCNSDHGRLSYGNEQVPSREDPGPRHFLALQRATRCTLWLAWISPVPPQQPQGLELMSSVVCLKPRPLRRLAWVVPGQVSRTSSLGEQSEAPHPATASHHALKGRHCHEQGAAMMLVRVEAALAMRMDTALCSCGIKSMLGACPCATTHHCPVPAWTLPESAAQSGSASQCWQSRNLHQPAHRGVRRRAPCSRGPATARPRMPSRAKKWSKNTVFPDPSCDLGHTHHAVRAGSSSGFLDARSPCRTPVVRGLKLADHTLTRSVRTQT